MAIYGIGAYFDRDVTDEFIKKELVGIGYDRGDAPELHEFIKALKVGDIVYIKSYSPSAENILVKGVGIITNSELITPQNTEDLIKIARHVRWLSIQQFEIKPPIERNNVRRNTMYEEWHPTVQNEIMMHVLNRLSGRSSLLGA